MSFCLVTVFFLVRNKIIDFIGFRHARNAVSLFNLHVVKNFVYFHISWLKIWPGLNKGLSQLLSGLLVCSVAHVSFPKTENFTNQVVLEELH